MRVEIVELAGGGAGLARVDGEVWFVAGALPGEIVDAHPQRRRAGIVEARASAVERPSPWRDPSPCPVAMQCGGCDLAHVRRDAAADVARAVVRGALRHAPAAIGDAVDRAEVRLSAGNYRIRARLHWDAASGVLGFRGPRSRAVTAVDACRVLSPRALAALPGMRAALARSGRPSAEVEWLESLDGAHAVAGWWSVSAVPPAPVAGLDGWQVLSPTGEILSGGWGASEVTMTLPVPLAVPVGAFFQGNRSLLPALFARVAAAVRAAGSPRVVDLYGGVGFLAAAARSAGVGRVTVVESHAGAAAAAARNLPGARVRATTAERFLAAAGKGDGVLALLDPPRVGLSREAKGALLAWRPEAMVVLGCDAARFGRDAAAFLAAGYRLVDLELWELFAGSHHVEILATFAR